MRSVLLFCVPLPFNILQLYEVEFEGICPVGNCLIIKANNLKEAKMIASKTIAHTEYGLPQGGNLKNKS